MTETKFDAGGVRAHSIDDYPGPVRGFVCFCWHEYWQPFCCCCCNLNWSWTWDDVRKHYKELLGGTIIGAYIIGLLINIVLIGLGQISGHSAKWLALWLPMCIGIIAWIWSFFYGIYALIKRKWLEAALSLFMFLEGTFVTIALEVEDLPTWAFLLLIFGVMGILVAGVVLFLIYMMIESGVSKVRQDWQEKRGQYTVDKISDNGGGEDENEEGENKEKGADAV